MISLMMGFAVVQWENANSVSVVNEKRVVGAVKLKVWRTVIDWPVSRAAIYKARILKVCDFNEDDYICVADLNKVIQRLCGDQRLSSENVNALIQKIFDEADLDDDSQLSFAEFEHVISKAPDFVNSFRIRV